MSRFDYQASLEISRADHPFAALLMAAMRKVDTRNAALLRGAFPGVWAELQDRYNAPGGVLPADFPYELERS